MRSQGVNGGASEVLTECILINNPVWLAVENRGRDPRLEDEPATKIDAADFLAAKGELECVITLGDRSAGERSVTGDSHASADCLQFASRRSVSNSGE